MIGNIVFKRRMMIVNTVFIFTVMSIKVAYVNGFIPEIQMPFKKVLGSSATEMGKIGSTLICREERQTLKDCATECFDRSSNNDECPGFYSNSTTTNICFLCRVSNSSEVNNGLHTTFTQNSKVYLLLHNKIEPEISIDFENYSGNTIYGKGVEGTTVGVVDSDHIPGFMGNSLHLHDGAYVRLTGSGTECWTNLDHCTSGMTVSIWFKAQSQIYSYIAASGTQYQKGFSLITHPDQTAFWIDLSSGRNAVKTDTVLTVGTWFYVVVTFLGDNGPELYINGIHDSMTKLTSAPQIFNTDWGARIGIKDDGDDDLHPIENAVVDEFKYYYRILSSVGK